MSPDGRFIQLLEIDSNCHYNAKSQARINYGFAYLNACNADDAGFDLPMPLPPTASQSLSSSGRSQTQTLFSSANASHSRFTWLVTAMLVAHLLTTL